MTGDPDGEILLETNRIGGAMEVRAIATSDGLEVAFTAPANALQSVIEHLARQKLAYVRRKRQADPKPEGSGGTGGRGGLIA